METIIYTRIPGTDVSGTPDSITYHIAADGSVRSRYNQTSQPLHGTSWWGRSAPDFGTAVVMVEIRRQTAATSQRIWQGRKSCTLREAISFAQAQREIS